MLQQQRNQYACCYYYCVATLNHNRAQLAIVNLRPLYRKKELIFVIKILEVCMEKLTKFEKFNYHTTLTYFIRNLYKRRLSQRFF